MDYSGILKRAWKILWKFKILWIFGILASCTANQGGGGGGGGSGSRVSGPNNTFNFNGRPFNGLSQLPQPLREWVFNIQHMANTGELWGYLIIFGILLVLLVIVLKLIFLAIGTVGEIGLVNGVWNVEEGAEKLSFGTLFNEGKSSFWKVILFKIALAVAWFIVAILMIILAVITLGCGLILLIPAMLIVSFVVWILVQFVMVGMVAEKMAIMDAVNKSWDLFKKNWTSSAIMGLILSIINFVACLVFAIPAILAALPAIFGIVTATASRTGGDAMTPILISVVLLLIYMPIGIFLHGLLVAYMSSAWTLTYRQLAGNTGTEVSPKSEEPVIDLPPAVG